MRQKIISFSFLFCVCFLTLLGCQNNNTTKNSSRNDAEEFLSNSPPNEMFWQLIDDSVLTVKITPWPPKANVPVTIIAEASLGDWNENDVLTEKVSYGIGKSETEDIFDWTPLEFQKSTLEAKHFVTQTKLPSGTIYLYFDASSLSFGEEDYYLEPWIISVK